MTSAGSLLPNEDDAGFLSLAAVQAAHTALLRSHRETGDTEEAIQAISGFLLAGVESGRMLDSDQDRWAVQSMLDYWVTTLHRATGGIPDATLADFDPELAPTLDDSLCPYLGLDAFKADQKDRYFGRQQLVDHLIERLKDSRLMALLGPSGSGKSSLVLAGLLPTLQDGAIPGSTDWVYFPPIVPGADPLESLARLVLPRDADAARIDAVAKSFRDDPNHLATVLGRQPPATVIVVDQFEEVFTLCNDEGDRQAFVENLLRVTRTSGPRHTVLLTMRDDFMGAVSRLPSLAPQFDKIIAVVVPPTAAELRDAIERPAERIGLKFEEGLVDLLLKDVVNEPAGLPLLQFTLLKLWEARDHNRITRAAYHRLGGGRECLARSADEVWEALGLQENKDTAERILLELVRPTEGREFTSKRVRRQRLYQLGIPANRITLALDRLVKARLLRVTPGETAEDDRIEVAHEALVRNWPKLRTWLEEERERMRHRIALTTAAEQWAERNRDKNLLYRGALLEEAAKYGNLGELESEFVEAGVRDRDRARRRKKAYWGVGIGMAVVTVAALFSAGVASARAREAQARAETARLAGQMAASQAAADTIRQVNTNLTLEKMTSDSLRVEAEAQRGVAEAARDTANSLFGASRAESNLRFRPERSVLIALHALSVQETPTAVAALSRSMQVWGMPTKLRRRDSSIFALATSPDRRVMAAASGSGVTLWNLEQGTEYRHLIGHTGIVRAVAFDSSGSRIATASSDGTTKIWDATTGRELRTFGTDGSGVLAAAYSPNARLLATGGLNGTTTVREVASGRVVAEVRGHSNAVWDVTFSPDGRTLLTLGQDGRGLLWNTTTWRLSDSLAVSPGDSAGQLKGIVNGEFSPDGTRIATASKDSTVKIWKARDGNLVLTIRGHTDEVWDVSYSPDGARLATGSSDQTVRIWDTAEGAELRVLRGHGNTVYSVSFVDRTHVVSADYDGNSTIWDLSLDVEAQRLKPSTGSAFRAVAISPNGKLVLAGADNGRTWAWERQNTGEEGDKLGAPSTLVRSNTQVRSLSIGASGRYLALVTEDSLTLWDLVAKRAVWTKSDSLFEAGDSTKFWNVAISPNDKYIATAGLDGMLRVFDLGDGRVRYRRKSTGEVVAVAFNPGRHRQLASAGRDGAIRLWDAETGVLQDSLTGHTDLVLDLAFDSSGSRLASSSGDGTARIWNLASGSRDARVVLQGHENWVWSVAFSRDGRLVATSSTDNTVRLWEPSSGEALRTIALPNTNAQSIEFGRLNQLILPGLDGVVRVYAISPIQVGTLMPAARNRIQEVLTDPVCRAELRIETCPETVESLLRKAQDAALEGNQARAFSFFQRAQQKDPELGLDANRYLGRLLTTYYIRESETAERAGDVAKATEHLRTARRWSPSLPLAPEGEAARATAAFRILEARQFAAQGQLDSALARIQRASAIDRQVATRELEAEVRELAGTHMAGSRAARADSLARQLRMTEAIAAMDSALALDSTRVTADQSNSVCWFGSLRRMAARVMPYCERAVRLDPTNTGIKDSRGLARALAGQVAGAIKDFTAYINDGRNSSASRSQRREWVVALRARTPPDSIFTDRLLTALASP